MTLPAFLIGRYEVTIGQWLAFLAALSPEERLRHLPKAQAFTGGATEAGFQRLEQTGAGWRFTFSPSTTRASALEGEPYRYTGRTRRAAQDWRRFPVTGITPEDMTAYLAWLDQSGHVPGARFCTEQEWERAARGADGRTFPHGRALHRDDADVDETYGFKDDAYGPDEVGSHPASDSPFGVSDLLGNAWEVVRSVNAAKHWVVRGGSWHNGQISTRIPNAWVVNRDFREVDAGLRVCADSK